MLHRQQLQALRVVPALSQPCLAPRTRRKEPLEKNRLPLFFFEASAVVTLLSCGLRLSAVATAVTFRFAACLKPWTTCLHPG